MWRSMWRWAGLALAFLGGLLWSGAALASVTPDQAELIMKRSGLWNQLGSVLAQARVGFSAAFSLGEGDPSMESADRLEEALERAYGADRLREVGLAMVSRELDARQAGAMRRWYDSPLGRKVDEVEKAAAATQTDLREIIRKGSDLVTHLPASRRNMLHQLLAETRIDEAMVEVSIHTVVATHQGVSAALPDGSRLSNKEVRATLEAERKNMLEAYRQLIVASFAQAYAELSDTELRKYVAFLQSPVGRRHTRLVHRTLVAALDDGGAVFIREAPDAMKKVAAAAAVPASAAASTP